MSNSNTTSSIKIDIKVDDYLRYSSFEGYIKLSTEHYKRLQFPAAHAKQENISRISTYGLFMPTDKLMNWQQLQDDRLNRRARLIKNLLAIRKRIEASGQPLLSWEEIENLLAERRGYSQ